MGGARESKVKVGPDAWRPVPNEEIIPETEPKKPGFWTGTIYFVPPERWNGRAHHELEVLPIG